MNLAHHHLLDKILKFCSFTIFIFLEEKTFLLFSLQICHTKYTVLNTQFKISNTQSRIKNPNTRYTNQLQHDDRPPPLYCETYRKDWPDF